MAKELRIYSAIGNCLFVASVPEQKDDPNSGLPMWYFEGKFFHLEVDAAADTVQWWPEMGPAPHWTAKWSEVEADPVTPLKAWMGETY